MTLKFRASLLIVMIVSLLMAGTTASTFVFSVGASTDPPRNPFRLISASLRNKMGRRGKESLKILVETSTNDYSGVIANVKKLGGKVRHQFKYVSALSATVKADSIAELAKNQDIVMIYHDDEVYLANEPPSIPSADSSNDKLDNLGLGIPIPLDLKEYDTVSITPEQLASFEPQNYWNPTAMGATDIWETTEYGQGSVVAIIDTGMWTGHWMFWETSIGGGVDFSWDVGDPTYEGWDNPNNHYHGGHVAGIVASTGGIVVPDDDLLAQAIELYTGITLPLGDPLGFPDTKVIWLLGMAPAAELYTIKVFDHTGGPTPTSFVIAGVEHAINLKAGGYDVDVISMSLGGPTLFDGRDLMDRTIDAATDEGITVVAAAGNDGPAPMSTGSPGTARTAITVAAAAHPVNTRVFWDYQVYGTLGIGYYLYTSEHPQIYAFSGRGPTGDGRLKPTLSATGIMVLSAYITGGDPFALAFASGTSMATPAVSGAVALINGYEEDFGAKTLPWWIERKLPLAYMEALSKGAKQLPYYGKYDQGAGYLDVKKAFDIFEKTSIYSLYKTALKKTRLGPWRLAKLKTIRPKKGKYVAWIKDLKPGHKKDFVLKIKEHFFKQMEWIRVDITDVELGNDLGLNSFEVYIQSAKRSTYDYYIDSANVWDDAWFIITDDETSLGGAASGAYSLSHVIESGYMKVTIENDWTSYDKLSCRVEITVKEKKTGWDAWKPTFKGTIRFGDLEAHTLDIPSGTSRAVIELSWRGDWSRYPTSDLDLILVDPDGILHVEGATLNSPERVVLESPADGTWTILVDGFEIYYSIERYKIRAAISP